MLQSGRQLVLGASHVCHVISHASTSQDRIRSVHPYTRVVEIYVYPFRARSRTHARIAVVLELRCVAAHLESRPRLHTRADDCHERHPTSPRAGGAALQYYGRNNTF